MLNKTESTNFFIVHYGELLLKGKNRNWFEDRLISNIRAKLHGLSISRIDKHKGRIVLELSGSYAVKDVADKLSRVFGVASFAAPALARSEMADIEQTAISAVHGRQFSVFAVRARRIDKNLPFTSQDVNENIGRKICEITGSRVDLEKPELTIWIDIFSDRTYIYISKFKGAGGLPTGTSGRVLSLISGGIDSPVAAWRMMKRGCLVNFIHFHSAPFTDKASQEKVEELCGMLSSWQGPSSRLVMIPFGNIQKKIVTSTHEKYRVVLYRRFMVRLASAISRELKAEALVTGEALGQVASQTLSNMATVGAVTTLPILRPLVGMDKQEIVDLAKLIGTYELSIQPHQDCCQFFEPRHPAIYTTQAEMEEIEKSLNIEELVKEGLTGAVFTDIKVSL